MRSPMVRMLVPVLVSLLGLSSVLGSITSPRETRTRPDEPLQLISFQVKAANPEVARQVAEAAERARKKLALLWLGQELPPWTTPCPIRVKLSTNGSGGATTFIFENGRVLSQEMNIEGTLERILNSVLPHEVMHTILAHHFGMPVPRWADEGIGVFCEDELEQNRHDQLTGQILNTPGRAIPLSRLFRIPQYPPDVMVMYAEGYSVAKFLVQREGRQTFLNFVRKGRSLGWDKAACECYGFADVEKLEQAWLNWIKEWRKKKDDQERPAEKTNPPGMP